MTPDDGRISVAQKPADDALDERTGSTDTPPVARSVAANVSARIRRQWTGR